MDIPQIANQVVTMIGPAMTALGSSAAAEAFYKEFGKDTWHFVKSLWTRLEPAVQADPNLKHAVDALQASPADEDNATVLKILLKQALQADNGLRSDLDRILDDNTRKNSPEIQNYYEKMIVHVSTVQGDFVIGSKLEHK